MHPQSFIYAALLGCFVVLLIYWTYLSSQFEVYIQDQWTNITNNTKLVLYWSPFYDQRDYWLGFGFDAFKDCTYNNCFATDNKRLIPLERFDALIFHETYRKRQHGVPWVRSSHQKYIWMNAESPVYTNQNLKEFNSYFNWTMSYRSVSDIIWRYGFMVKETTNYTIPSLKFLKNKSRLAAWFVSHCNTSSKRDDLTKEIQKSIPVDVFGDCGNFSCKRSDTTCYSFLEKRYKFYFSFENAYCTDYITEKLYNVLTKNIVPVVYGGGDYILNTPPHSVINVADFESVEDLVAYLKYLDANDTEYLKYFEWKKNYKIRNFSSACYLCKKLHEPVQESIYYNLHEWWWGKNNSKCKTDQFLPKIVRDLL